MWLLALLSLLLIIGYDKVAGMPRAAIAGADQPLAIPTAAMEGGGKLPARISEYVFLHQTRHEGFVVHAMTGGKACPE